MLLVYAQAKTAMVGKTWPNNTPLKMTIVYLLVYSKGKEQKAIAVERRPHPLPLSTNSGSASSTILHTLASIFPRQSLSSLILS